jgi:hypothetical protein
MNKQKNGHLYEKDWINGLFAGLPRLSPIILMRGTLPQESIFLTSGFLNNAMVKCLFLLNESMLAYPDGLPQSDRHYILPYGPFSASYL